jgi:hypothetical protein
VKNEKRKVFQDVTQEVCCKVKDFIFTSKRPACPGKMCSEGWPSRNVMRLRAKVLKTLVGRGGAHLSAKLVWEV